MTPVTTEAKTTLPVSLGKLIRGSGARVTNLALAALSGILLTPYLVRSLGPEQYGMWALAYAVIGYYSLMDLGMSAAVFTHVSFALGKKDYSDANRIYGSGLAVFGSTGLALALATVVIFFIIHHMHTLHSTTLAWVLLIVGLVAAMGFPMRVPFGALNAGSHFDVTSGHLMLATILRATGTVIVLYLHYGIIQLALVNALSSVIVNTLVVMAVKRKYSFLHVLRPRFERKTAVRLMRFGFPVLFGQLADRIRLQTDSLTVSFFLGLAVLTHYSIATTLAMYYMDVVTAVIGVLAPVLAMQKSVDDANGVRRSILAGTRLGISIAGFIAFAIIAWGHAFILRWMGAAYLDAYPVLVVLSLAIFCDVSQITSVDALYATLNQKYYAAINVAEAVANLTLSILLARRYGMIGIAFGTLLPSVVVRLFIQPFILQQRLGLSVKEYWSVNVPTLLRALACLGLPFALSHYLLGPSYPKIFAVAALLIVMYALPMWYFEFQMKGARETIFKVRTFLSARASAASL